MTYCPHYPTPYFLKKENFRAGNVNFHVIQKPPSAQNKVIKKQELKRSVQQITQKCDYIITGTCWVHIEYSSSNYNRYKNPGVYDVDNIIKPILDSLIGYQGIILDDTLFEKVSVNWLDTPHEEHFEVSVEYPDLLYVKKEYLQIVKSSNGWCLPMPKLLVEKSPDVIVNYFKIWDLVTDEDQYYKWLGLLPIQQFIYHTKIRDKNYNTIQLKDVEKKISTANKTLNTDTLKLAG